MTATIIAAFIALTAPNGSPFYIDQDQIIAVGTAHNVGACDTIIFTSAPNPLYVCETAQQVLDKLAQWKVK